MSFWKTMPARRGIKLSARECCMLLWLGLPPLLFFGRISVSMLWAWKCAHVLTQKQVCTSSLSWGYILQITYMNVKGAFQNNNTGKEWGPDLMILSELLKLDFQQSDLNVKKYIALFVRICGCWRCSVEKRNWPHLFAGDPSHFELNNQFLDIYTYT